MRVNLAGHERSVRRFTRGSFGERWLPHFVFVLSPLAVFPRAMFAAGMMDGGDDKLAFLPYLLHSAAKLARLEPFWTSELWMGMPLLGEPETATLYPTRLMLLFMPPALGYTLYVLVHYVLSQVFGYWYARELGQSRPAATLTAVAYGFSGFMLGHRGHVPFVVAGAWTPLFLYFVRRAIEGRRRSPSAYLGAGLSFAAVWFGGAMQLGTYLVLMTITLHAAESWLERSFRPIAVACAALTVGVMIAMAQILPGLDYLRELFVASTARTEYDLATRLSFHPLLFPTLALPTGPLRFAESYSRAGTLVLFAAATACAGFRGARPIVRAWALVAAMALVLMAGRFVPPVARLLHALPVVSLLRGPARHNYELGLSIAVLSGFGLDTALRTPFSALRSALLRTLGATSAFAAASVLALALLPRVATDYVTLRVTKSVEQQGLERLGVLALAAAALWLLVRALGPRARGAAAGLAVAAALLETRVALAADAGIFRDVARHSVPTSFDLGTERAALPARIIPAPFGEAGVESLPGDAVLYVAGLGHLFGYASIAPRDSAEMLDLDMHGHAQHFGSLVCSRLPSVFGVSYIVMAPDLCGNDVCGYEPIRRVEGNNWLYRNPHAMPRAYAVARLVAAQSVSAARSVLRDDPSFDPKSAAVVESPPPGVLSAGRVERADFGGEWADISVDAPDRSTFLVVNDRFARNWIAAVDGAPTPIYRTNGIVRGVLVPQGHHRVTMRYVPAAALVGFAIAGLGIALGFAAPRLEKLLQSRTARSG